VRAVRKVRKVPVVCKAFPDATVTQAQLARVVRPERTALRVQAVYQVRSDPLGRLAHPVQAAHRELMANKVCAVNRVCVVNRVCQGVLGQLVRLVRVAHRERAVHLVHLVHQVQPVQLARLGLRVPPVAQR